MIDDEHGPKIQQQHVERKGIIPGDHFDDGEGRERERERHFTNSRG
jgi:hypothetical protein